MSNNNKDKVVSDNEMVNEVVNVIEFDSIKFKSEVEKINDTNEIRFRVKPLESKLNEINYKIEDTQKIDSDEISKVLGGIRTSFCSRIGSVFVDHCLNKFGDSKLNIREGEFPSPSQCNDIAINYHSIFKTYIDNEKPINKNRTDFKTLSTNVPHLNKRSNDDLPYLGRIVKLYFEELRNTFIVKKMDELINEKNEIIEQLNILNERGDQLMDDYQRKIKKVG
jgi:hypothetical protein